MTFAVLISAAILLSAGYAAATADASMRSSPRLAESAAVRAIVLLGEAPVFSV